MQEWLQLFRNRSWKNHHLQILRQWWCDCIRVIQESHIQRHIRFINNKLLNFVNIKCLSPDQIQNPTGSPNHDLRLIMAQLFNLPLFIRSANVIVNDNRFWRELRNLLCRFINLICQFPTRRCDDRLGGTIRINFLENWQKERVRLPASGLGLTNDTFAFQDRWNQAFLNRCWFPETHRLQCLVNKGFKIKILKFFSHSFLLCMLRQFDLTSQRILSIDHRSMCPSWLHLLMGGRHRRIP